MINWFSKLSGMITTVGCTLVTMSMKLLLQNAYIRYWIAYWLIKWIGYLDFYEPAKEAAPKLYTLLIEHHQIDIAQLRRLVLIALRHTYSEYSYFDIEFTTSLRWPVIKEKGYWRFFPEGLIFLIYNILSGGNPIADHIEYEKQVGGIPPVTIDRKRHLVDFFTDQHKLNVQVEVGKIYFPANESVQIIFTLENLSNKSLEIGNQKEPPVQFTIESGKGNVQKHIPKINRSNMSQQNIISPTQRMVVNWYPKLPEASHYSAKVDVYISHYRRYVTLQIEFWYGIKPGLIIFPTKDFLAL